MAVTLYNSLTNKKEELIPLDGKTVRMYSCGVTVYDRCHIGHARSLYLFEVIRRYLKFRGFDVRFVRNITDIDDKIINKAKDTGRDWQEVVRDNIDAYYADLKGLDVPPADAEPRATENIDGMIAYVRALIEKGYAYETDGDVYYRVRRFREYGKLSGQSVDEMREAVRIEKDVKKEDPLDFALWKKSREGEPSWDSPWGPGRPGWHIECSVMSLKYCGCETLDIHAGGRDLIFPHHENEIAQAEGYTGKPFARYWIHHGLLTINSQKMAKSLGNFITIKGAVAKHGANALKLFFLSSHYRSPIDYSEERLAEAGKRYDALGALVKELRTIEAPAGKAVDGMPSLQDFTAAMDDDFNTPRALGVLSDLIHWCWKTKESGGKDKEAKLAAAFDVIGKMTEVFGLTFEEEQPLNDKEESLLKERETARANKDFKKSDELRDRLMEFGVLVQDTPQGQKWRRRT